MRNPVKFNRTLAIAMIVGTFFLLALAAMLLTGILSGGNPRS
jgi:hypothetical protein